MQSFAELCNLDFVLNNCKKNYSVCAQATIRSVLILNEGASRRLAGILVGVFAVIETVLCQGLINMIPKAVFTGVLFKVAWARISNSGYLEFELDFLPSKFPISLQTLKGSFSAVSTPSFARKYSLE